ncbi:MAG: hypothetical protein LBD99_02145, partial [Candidatus Margulisbacteria bacterium]|nr:hypothetical protein [Candidatus Margulisiibacteriota bacterium]
YSAAVYARRELQKIQGLRKHWSLSGEFSFRRESSSSSSEFPTKLTAPDGGTANLAGNSSAAENRNIYEFNLLGEYKTLGDRLRAGAKLGFGLWSLSEETRRYVEHKDDPAEDALYTNSDLLPAFTLDLGAEYDVLEDLNILGGLNLYKLTAAGGFGYSLQPQLRAAHPQKLFETESWYNSDPFYNHNLFYNLSVNTVFGLFDNRLKLGLENSFTQSMEQKRQEEAVVYQAAGADGKDYKHTDLRETTYWDGYMTYSPLFSIEAAVSKYTARLGIGPLLRWEWDRFLDRRGEFNPGLALQAGLGGESWNAYAALDLYGDKLNLALGAQYRLPNNWTVGLTGGFYHQDAYSKSAGASAQNNGWLSETSVRSIIDPVNNWNLGLSLKIPLPW